MEEIKEKETEEKIEQKEERKTFYSEIKEQIDGLFEHNQSEKYLEDMIPDSKWVKVEFEDSGDYYVFGLIYKDDQLVYICYGVPGVWQASPPKQLSGYPVWLPLDENRRDGFGYWLTYQDAETGESVKAIIE